jgi:hypothetical protein
MGFQEEVTKQEMASGVVGEFAFDSPHRVKTYTLDSGSAANNVIGRAFTVKSEGVAQAGGTGVFAGIMINPKTLARDGLFNGDDNQLAVANNVVAEMCEMGELYVALPAAAAIGNKLTYNTTTGALGAVTPTTSFTGVIAVTTGVLTVTDLAAGGYIAVGSVLSGAGIPVGTRITAQASGTTGSNGTYNTNIITAVSSTTMTIENSPLAAGANHAFVPNAVVANQTVSGAGLAIVKLTN